MLESHTDCKNTVHVHLHVLRDLVWLECVHVGQLRLLEWDSASGACQKLLWRKVPKVIHPYGVAMFSLKELQIESYK